VTSTVHRDELQALRDSARDYLATVLRRDAPLENETEKPWWWPDLAALGWLGLLAPEQFGGSDAGVAAAVVVAEELAYADTTTPYLASAVLATRMLSAADSGGPAGPWLSGMVDGKLSAAVVVTGSSGLADRSALGVRVSRAGDGVALDGVAGYVSDALSAELLLVAGSDEAGELVVVAVESTASGVTVEPARTYENGHRVAHVSFEAVVCEPAAVLARGPRAEAIYDATLRLGILMLAADSLGAARRAFELALDYAKHRYQFGRPIGSFQAIKHKLADMYVLLTGSAALIEQTTAALDRGEDCARQVATAGSYVREAAARIAGDSMQVHGANGYTWEHPCHRLLKRTKFNERYLATLWAERDALAGLVLEPPDAESETTAR
jgi:alkylation response protein AidB-like acyl-CoA dehydrogenase